MLSLGLFLQVERDFIDAGVEDADHDERDPVVTDHQHRVEDPILHELHVAVTLQNGSLTDEELPTDDGREEEQDRDDPGGRHHQLNLLLRPPAAILRRHLDGAEAVYGDEEHGVYGRQADLVVHGQPQVADDLAHRPVFTHDQVHGVKRHGEAADQQVGQSERADEVVRRLADAALQDEGEDDDQVTNHGDDGGDAGQQ